MFESSARRPVHEKLCHWLTGPYTGFGFGGGPKPFGGGQNFFSGVPPYGEKFHRPFGPKNTVVPPYVIFWKIILGGGQCLVAPPVYGPGHDYTNLDWHLADESGE